MIARKSLIIVISNYGSQILGLVGLVILAKFWVLKITNFSFTDCLLTVFEKSKLLLLLNINGSPIVTLSEQKPAKQYQS